MRAWIAGCGVTCRFRGQCHRGGGDFCFGPLRPACDVLDDAAVPTLMIAGLGPVAEAQPRDDVQAIIALIAKVVGTEPSFVAFARSVTEEVGAQVPAYPAPVDGESLYAAADAVEVAVLAALGSR